MTSSKTLAQLLSLRAYLKRRQQEDTSTSAHSIRTILIHHLEAGIVLAELVDREEKKLGSGKADGAMSQRAHCN